VTRILERKEDEKPPPKWGGNLAAPMKHTIVNMIEGLRRAFDEVIGDSLGFSAKDAIVFHLRMRLGRDPFKVLWENPAAFYTELEMIFGSGAKFLIKLFVDGLNKKFNSKHSPETFLKFLTTNDKGLLAEWHALLEGILGNERRKDHRTQELNFP
jgi:hypothetical protein